MESSAVCVSEGKLGGCEVKRERMALCVLGSFFLSRGVERESTTSMQLTHHTHPHPPSSFVLLLSILIRRGIEEQ